MIYGESGIPLDDERRWYRYHHLFANLLEQRLHLNQADLVSELHSPASRWFAENGFKNEAVDHALAAQDYPLAAQLIENIVDFDWDGGGESRLLQWLKKLPDEKLNTNSNLYIFYACELFKGE